MIIIKKNYLNKNNYILVGNIGRPYGILGWTYLNSFTEKKENIFNYLPWFIKGKKIYNIKWKKNNKRYVFSIKNITDRNSISLLTNSNIFIKDSILPTLSNNELYWKDIINCHIFSIKNIYYGKVINLINNTVNDLLIVKNKKEKINLIPFIEKKIIKKVDLIKNFIIVDYHLDL